MHADAEFSRQSACMHRITVLLALAFPGRVSISPQNLPWDFCKRKGGLEAPPAYPVRSLAPGNGAGMSRENTLSCLNSILMASCLGTIFRISCELVHRVRAGLYGREMAS